ncbi:hypothetical protein BJ944DRAFT_244510 [Cunninghamella echinulata]|nr:hypothetical protein BJ944DRAFT_244510 [Cunninghamella echinulata]
MNYGFKSIVIEPFNGYLDFQGPLNPENASGSITLKGDIHLDLTKSVKVKSATIKFKGYSRVCHQNTIDSVDISTPILPKLKTQIFSSTTTLGPGQVTLPWELEILNVYPASVMIKRASINYKIELSISLGLKRAVTSTYPIVIRRHLLPCKEVAPLIPTKMYSKTISTKFHYEITAPRIVCLAQTCIPFNVKLLSIGSQKRVLHIRSQILQVELYRCNALPKSEANMTRFKTQLMKPKKPQPSGKKGELNKYAKYTKRTTPAIIHTLDETEPMSSNQPILLRHPLDEYLNLGLESPLASIYHQLEITFQFGAKFEDIRAKIPILISSTTTIDTQANNNHQPPPMPLYPYEKLNLPEPLFVMDETRLEKNGTAPTMKALAPSAKNADTTSGNGGELEDMDGASVDFNNNNGSERSNSPTLLRSKQSRSQVDSALCMNSTSSGSYSNGTMTTTVATATTSYQRDLQKGHGNINLCISSGSHDVEDDHYHHHHHQNNNIKHSINNHHLHKNINNKEINSNSNSMDDNIMNSNNKKDMDIMTTLSNSLPIPPLKHRRPSHPSLASSTNDKSSSPTLHHQQPQQRFLRVDNMDSSDDMGSRSLDHTDPSQRRQRSVSQSFIIDNSQLSQHQKRLQNTKIHTQSQSNLFSAANNNNNKSLLLLQQHQQHIRLQSTSPTPPSIIPKNKLRPHPQQQYNPPSECDTSSSSLNESNTSYDDDDDEDDVYEDDASFTNGSDRSSHAAPSLTSGASQTESSSYELQSRPSSPVYPNAPGLPPVISLRPRDANPVALLEESFVPSPGSLVNTPIAASHPLAAAAATNNNNARIVRASVQYDQNVFYDGTTFGAPSNSSSDMMSIISNAQSSVLDTDEEMMRLMQQMGLQNQQTIHQKRSLEQHYTYAELPPIPRSSNNQQQQPRPTTIYYLDDSDGEEIDHSAMYDSDDQSLADINNSNHSHNIKKDEIMKDDDDLFIPPIAGSPLPPLPHEAIPPVPTESVCICPKHGVTVNK